jgi:hypothetical protein
VVSGLAESDRAAFKEHYGQYQILSEKEDWNALFHALRRPTNWGYSLLELGRDDDAEPFLQAALKTFEVLYGRDTEVLGGL